MLPCQINPTSNKSNEHIFQNGIINVPCRHFSKSPSIHLRYFLYILGPIRQCKGE